MKSISWELYLEQHNFAECFKLANLSNMSTQYQIKANIYLEQLAFEEALAYAREMEKLSSNQPIQLLNSYLLIAKIYHKSHKAVDHKSTLDKFHKLYKLLTYFNERLTIEESTQLNKLLLKYYDYKISILLKDQLYHKINEILSYELFSKDQLYKFKVGYLNYLIIKGEKGIKSKLPRVPEIEQAVIDFKQPLDNIFALNYRTLYYIELQEYKMASEDVLRILNIIQSKNIVNNKKYIELYQTIKWHISSLEIINLEDIPKKSLEYFSEYPINRNREKAILYKLNPLHYDYFNTNNWLTLYKNEFISIRGSSNSGKSTFLRNLLGLEINSNSSIILDKINLGKLSVEEMTNYRNNNIGFIIENRVILPKIDLRNYKNVQTKLNKKINLIVNRIVSIINSKEENTKFTRFMQELIILFSLKHMLIIAEEPFVLMDDELADLFMKLLSSYQKLSSSTIVIETHKELVHKYADVQIFIREGKIGTILEN